MTIMEKQSRCLTVSDYLHNVTGKTGASKDVSTSFIYFTESNQLYIAMRIINIFLAIGNNLPVISNHNTDGK